MPLLFYTAVTTFQPRDLHFPRNSVLQETPTDPNITEGKPDQAFRRNVASLNMYVGKGVTNGRGFDYFAFIHDTSLTIMLGLEDWI